MSVEASTSHSFVFLEFVMEFTLLRMSSTTEDSSQVESDAFSSLYILSWVDESCFSLFRVDSIVTASAARGLRSKERARSSEGVKLG